MVMSKNRGSGGGGRPSSESVAGTTTYASPEARWLTERLSGGEGLISGWGIRGTTLSYACPGWGRWRTLSVAKAEAKGEVGANSEEVK